jgi:prephenate dehydratase
VVVAPQDAAPTGDDKTSIAFTAQADLPGVLHTIRTPLAEARLQLTKIESRPTKAFLGEYVFLIDFLGHRLEPHVGEALERARASCDAFKIFGSYPRFKLETPAEATSSPMFPAR